MTPAKEKAPRRCAVAIVLRPLLPTYVNTVAQLMNFRPSKGAFPDAILTACKFFLRCRQIDSVTQIKKSKSCMFM